VENEPITVAPEDYRRWRARPLGALTEAREIALVLSTAGPLAGRHLLDVGCGDGTYAIAAARRGAVVSAVDRSAGMIDAARLRARDLRVAVEFCRADATRLPFATGTFDLVTAVTVLCFVPDAGSAVREMARVLAPGGRLVIGELNRWSTWAAWRRLRARFGSPRWRHASFRSPRSLARLIRDSGLVPERVRGAIYYPPLPFLARVMGPAERPLRALTTVGAAFLAAGAAKPAP